MARNPRRARSLSRRLLGQDAFWGYLLVSPAVLYILVLVAYPFLLSIYFSLSNSTVAGGDSGFVGLANYISLVQDPTFRQALFNSLSFTFLSEIGKAVLGIGLAFLLLQTIRGKKLIRGLLMIPFTMPLALALQGWYWLFNPQLSVINRVFGDMLHVMHQPYPVWLGDPFFSYVAILMVNIWRGFPFGAIIVLAGLTSIQPDILDAARVDGAGFLRRWHYVIVPMIAPILFIGLIYDVTFTLGDITIVDLLTQGGPNGATQTLPMLAYQTGIEGGNLSRGAADALILFPILFVGMIFFLRMLYRRGEST
ncbi:MAG: sugar ABC transporter permease [Candidatus Dormiibacterota bacterium]